MDLLDDESLLDITTRAKGTDPAAVTRELSREKSEIPGSNRALSDWATNLGRGRAAEEACHKCGSATRYSCQQCNHRFCAADYWVMFGLCRGCAKDDRVQAWHKEQAPESKNWLEQS